MSTVPPEPYEWTPEALTYERTTTYHWPNFDVNATDIEGEWTNSEGIGTGPFGFGSDVKLTDTSVSRLWLMAIYAKCTSGSWNFFRKNIICSAGWLVGTV